MRIFDRNYRINLRVMVRVIRRPEHCIYHMDRNNVLEVRLLQKKMNLTKQKSNRNQPQVPSCR